MNKKIFLAAVSLSVFLIPLAASAHQPNYIGQSAEIKDYEPTVSKAYYGELAGQPAVYTVVANQDFKLSVNILSPDVPGAHKDFTVKIENSSGQSVGVLNDPPVDWPRWYEEFAGDWYRQGPELKIEVPKGTYTLTVQNPSNSGKYSLAIGEDEIFPLSQSLHTLKELYATKTSFFEKPWYNIFSGSIGRYLLIGSITLMVILIGLGWFVVYKIISRRKKHLS